MRRAPTFLSSIFLAACGGPAAAVPDAPAAEVPDAPAAERIGAPESAAPSPSIASAEGSTCIMLYECGCNARCVTIDLPSSKLRDGAEAKVSKGDLANERVFVRKSSDGIGVFTVQRGDPRRGIEVCRSLTRAPWIGYLCAMEDSGAPRSCPVCP